MPSINCEEVVAAITKVRNDGVVGLDDIVVNNVSAHQTVRHHRLPQLVSEYNGPNMKGKRRHSYLFDS